MSETRRARLVEIQKREQLKGRLVNKFKLKYGNKGTLSNFIENEVHRFLANDRLTEANLKGLDGKIQKEAGNRDKKDAILDDRKSQRSQSAYSRVSGRSARSGGLSAAGLSALNAQNNGKAAAADADARSNASRASRQSKAVSVGRRSQATSVRSKQPSQAYTEINENDEWVAI